MTTCDDPGILGSVHLLLVRFTEDQGRFVFVKVADDDSHAVLLQTERRHTIMEMHGRKKLPSATGR